ncbi:hypothetical protein Rs2_01057 [Raphanus sativus]|nr:hypothetical protein Rs2_01057 [Raphanus sativus]
MANNSISPDHIKLCPDTKQSMYCQLLCGLVQRDEVLWPKAKCIEATVTGSMAQYIPALEFYSNNELPLVSKVYASSEAFFGLNLEPLCKPQHVSYTFLTNMSYFEFIDVDDDGGTAGEIVDLVNVKLGHYYEPLVTNFSGKTGYTDVEREMYYRSLDFTIRHLSSDSYVETVRF